MNVVQTLFSNKATRCMQKSLGWRRDYKICGSCNKYASNIYVWVQNSCENWQPPSQIECTCTLNLASFPGLPTIQFLIACSMQNREREGRANFYHMNDVSGVLYRKNGLEALSVKCVLSIRDPSPLCPSSRH